tara:strand:- start:26 stop:166 length:141 start_codon:yes stop_codon:yes gene_type:complete
MSDIKKYRKPTLMMRESIKLMEAGVLKEALFEQTIIFANKFINSFL